jgi:hypothetical protein
LRKIIDFAVIEPVVCGESRVATMPPRASKKKTSSPSRIMQQTIRRRPVEQ